MTIYHTNNLFSSRSQRGYLFTIIFQEKSFCLVTLSCIFIDMKNYRTTGRKSTIKLIGCKIPTRFIVRTKCKIKMKCFNFIQKLKEKQIQTNF